MSDKPIQNAQIIVNPLPKDIEVEDTKLLTSSIVSASSGWDMAGEYGDIQLYDATLAIDTKKFKKGDVISCVTFLFSQSLVQLWQPVGPKVDGFQSGEVVEEFSVTLTPKFN
jgi:hypothetical protein